MNRRGGGFTLIELAIVVAVIALLLSIAVPSYQAQVVKTRRSEGKALLLEVAGRLERCFTRHSAYNHADCAAAATATSEGGWYQVSADPLAASSFTLRAAPQKAQASDDAGCGTLTLTHVGVRARTGSAPDGYDCW